MREIKFRVWTGSEYIYTRGDIDYFDNDGIEHMAQEVVFTDAWGNVCIYDCTTNGAKTIKIIKDGVLEQYIGEKDCKRTEEYPEGQKIYENDIVRFYYNSDNGNYSDTAAAGFTEMLDQVVFKKGCFYFINNDIGRGAYAFRHAEYCEIIGNIHDKEVTCPDNSK